jgi:3-methyladenine DNA glycosylase AlkD
MAATPGGGPPLARLRAEMRALADPARAKSSQWFFQTAPGQYGAGDRFLGLTVPQQRALARRHRDLPPADVRALLRSPYHEHRLTALLILVERYRRGDETTRAGLVELYLAHLGRVNNWDLVDSSAPYLLGPHLLGGRAGLLDRLAGSPDLWGRRVAIVTTLHFIRHGRLDDTLRLAARLLGDEHDLIHKATGWMLRCVGDRDPAALRAFLEAHVARMPRTMLRYAIEKLPERERRRWLAAPRDPGARRRRTTAAR